MTLSDQVVTLDQKLKETQGHAETLQSEKVISCYYQLLSSLQFVTVSTNVITPFKNYFYY